MKKTLIALLSVTVVMLFAVSAFALHAVPEMFEYTPSIVKSKSAQVEIGGHIRIRGEYADNNSDLSDDTNDRKAAYDQRVRLSTKATLSPNTYGMIEIEAVSDDDVYAWGCDGNEMATGYYDVGNCKKDSLHLRQAYVAHQGKDLGMLSGWKAGHMLLALGNGLFFDHTKGGDDAIVVWFSPQDGMEISLNTIKFQENNTSRNDDANAYVATFAGAFGGANMSADVTYVDHQDAFGNEPLHLWNIGLRGDGTVGPAKIYGDVEFQNGKAEGQGATGDDVDLKGYAFMLGADFAAGPVNVNVEGAYGSGDDIDDEDESKAFVTSLSSGQHYTYLYDQKVVAASGVTNSGLTNTWYIKAGVDGQAMADVKYSADLYYLQASEEVSDVKDFDSQDIGVELDGKVEYQIDSNLVYYVEGGYLWAGDFYANVTGDKDQIDNPYSVRHGIVLQF